MSPRVTLCSTSGCHPGRNACRAEVHPPPCTAGSRRTALSARVEEGGHEREIGFAATLARKSQQEMEITGDHKGVLRGKRFQVRGLSFYGCLVFVSAPAAPAMLSGVHLCDGGGNQAARGYNTTH